MIDFPTGRDPLISSARFLTANNGDAPLFIVRRGKKEAPPVPLNSSTRRLMPADFLGLSDEMNPHFAFHRLL